MFSRFCNSCHKITNVQFVNFQRCYRKHSKKNVRRSKSNVHRTATSQNVEGKTPIIVCKRKEFNFYEDQTYSKHETIPLASKGWQHYKSKGDHFFIYPYTDLTKKAQEVDDACEEDDMYDSFAQFNLDPRLTNILKRYSITKPLSIQKNGIPKIVSGANTVIAAETGCGKTLTYLLPMIDEIIKWKELAKDARYNFPLGLIVTPTRELAFQIAFEAKKICQYLDIRTKLFTGGQTKKMLLDPPVEEVDIVIASFGVISKLTTNKIIKLDMVRHIVLDEADALFHDTFEEKLQVFLKRVPLGFAQNTSHPELPTAAQFTLVSATMPSRMSTVLENIINVDSLVSVSSEKLHHILVPQKFMRLGENDKPVELLKYIKPKVANKEPVIVFNNNNSTCNWIGTFLNNSNIETVCLHGDMPLYDRQNQYANFKSGKCRVLCTTNAGSRGLDTTAVRHILNYQFPTATADYIHRCGRTGRDGIKDCRVTNFISTLPQVNVLQKIERAVRRMRPIPIINIQPKEEEEEDNELGFEIENNKQMPQEEFSIPY